MRARAAWVASRQSFHRWLRQAGLLIILIGTIVSASLDEADAKVFAIMAVEPNLITPFDEMRPFENVIIVGAPPDEHPWITDKIILPYYRNHAVIDKYLYFRNFNESAGFYSLRSEKKWLRGVLVYIIRGNVSWRPNPIDTNSHIFYRRVSAIFPFWLNGKTSDIEFWGSSISFWQFLRIDFAVQCSGQLIIEPIEINESAFRYFQSLPSGFPQAISRAPKGESEGRYNSGCDSSEESIMSVDKAQRTNRLSFDEDGDDLAVIIGTLGALFGGILTYAGLKRGCDLIFGPKKEK
jgi:hypothetical protein